MTPTVEKLSIKDHGRRMTLAEYHAAELTEGYRYELGRGVLVVSEIPNIAHGRLVQFIRSLFFHYRGANPPYRLDYVSGGSESRVILPLTESDRHPDVCVYKNPQERRSSDLWEVWVPDLVVEVISAGSRQRDYVEKREEYWEFGIPEYWIIDPKRDQLLVLKRTDEGWAERTINPPTVYKPRRFPGLNFDLGAAFAEAGTDE